jgi:hypothetical protein
VNPKNQKTSTGLDSAMERTVEEPSAADGARKASGSLGSTAQRTEATSGLVPDEARVQEAGSVLALTGDGRREKGGTREFRVSEGVHSPSEAP